jgi:cytochrome P450
VQDRIATEVCLAGKRQGETIAELSELPCTTRVLNEILRLYPNEWLLTRRAVEEDRLPCGVRIRRGEEVMISPYVIQRDARFFPNPDRFDPERFAGAPTWPQMAYIPFGAGPRMCLGEFYARLVITVGLAKTISRWRVEAIEPLPPLEIANLFSSQPRGGRLMLRLRKRN